MISVCTPLLSSKEEEYVLDCVRTNWISSGGKYIRQLEEGFSRYCGQKYGIATSNGTTALHLALAALGIQKGDEVIVPSFSIASTAFAVIYCGAKPVFVDSEPRTWNINPDLIEKKITSRTKAIIPVHTYGHPCDMERIMKIAKKHKLFVVEDAAEAHAAECNGKKAGSFGHVSCFSFYANKIITSGEGGMVLTSNPRLAAKCQRLKNLGFLPHKRFWHKEIGFNYRMTNLQAAIGVAQLEQIDKLALMRRQNAFMYNSLLSTIPGLKLPVEMDYAHNVYWMYGLLVSDDFGVSRDYLMRRLKDMGVETRTFFLPLHNQPIFKKLGVASREQFPVADDLAKRGMYLPSSSGLKKEEIQYIYECIVKIREKK